MRKCQWNPACVSFPLLFSTLFFVSLYCILQYSISTCTSSCDEHRHFSSSRTSSKTRKRSGARSGAVDGELKESIARRPEEAKPTTAREPFASCCQVSYVPPALLELPAQNNAKMAWCLSKNDDGNGRTCQRQDIFAFNPHYEWTSHKTRVGMFLSYLTIAFLLFYIGVTTRDYVVRPPELVSQGDIDLLQVAREFPFRLPRFGLRVGYTNTSDSSARVAALANENPYVRFQIRHVVMKDQVRVRETDLLTEECIVSSIISQCPIVNDTFRLKGILFKQDYEFVEILVKKCTGDNACAPLEQINEMIQSGAFRIRAQVSLESEQFDVERFHATGAGFTISNRSFEYFNLPSVELQSDIILQARRISKEERYAGSPPLPETEINVLSLRGRDTNFRPRTTNETDLMTFVIRLADNVLLEEVNYWCPSILDLFGLWGAMASFAASLSLGFIAHQYNKWHFYRHFHKATMQKRRDAQQQTLATMNWVRNNDAKLTPNRYDIYDNLQTQYDALLIEPDIRLFESHHFNTDGRMAMSAMELKIPTTAFGELRRIAILEHSKKKRAAKFLSVWYGRHLVQKGFVRDEKRRREIFAPADEGLSSGTSVEDNNFQQERSGRFSLQTLRLRKGNASKTDSFSQVSVNDDMSIERFDDPEKGVAPSPETFPQDLRSNNTSSVRLEDGAKNDAVRDSKANSPAIVETQSSPGVPSVQCDDDGAAVKQKALDLIAAMDFGSPA